MLTSSNFRIQKWIAGVQWGAMLVAASKTFTS